MQIVNQTLFDRIGGEVAISQLVDGFHDRVLQDPDLEPYFRHVPMDKFREMQLAFFTAALDGPVRYSGRRIDEVHKGRGITSRQLSHFMEHLLATLQEVELNEQETEEMYSRIGLFGEDVLDGPCEGTE